MPLRIRFGLDHYAQAQTVDTRPFFLGRVGPGNEAKDRRDVTSLYLHMMQLASKGVIHPQAL